MIFCIPKFSEIENGDDMCRCGHDRCRHKKGKYKCFQIEGIYQCTCQIFTRDRRDSDPPEPTPEDLEKLEVLFK